MKRATLLLLAGAMLLASCYGKKVKISDMTEVYIKKDATQADAKLLGNYLDNTYKPDKERSFQLSKENNTYTVKMVVDQKKLKEDPSLDQSFMALRYLFASQVFKGNDVKLILTDNSFNDIKTVKDTTYAE